MIEHCPNKYEALSSSPVLRIKQREKENRMVVTRNYGEGQSENCCIMGIEVQFCKMRKFWRSVANNMNRVNTTELYTYKWLRK